MWNYKIYIFGRLKKRMKNFARGEQFVMQLNVFFSPDEYKEAKQYVKILKNTTGYNAVTLFGPENLKKPGELFWHPFFFS